MKSAFWLGLLALLGSMPLAAQQSLPPTPPEVEVQPGDVVRVDVWLKPELSGEFYVSADGSLADPFYAPVRVTGISFSAAAERVRDHVARIEASPRVWVEPLFRVMVGGEVRQPNTYTLRREHTVAQAVAQAGGMTDSGALDRVRLTRDGRVHEIDLTDPADPLAHSPIHSGDEIMVLRRAQVLREYVTPVASMMAVVVSLLNIFTR